MTPMTIYDAPPAHVRTFSTSAVGSRYMGISTVTLASDHGTVAGVDMDREDAEWDALYVAHAAALEAAAEEALAELRRGEVEDVLADEA